MPRPLSTALKAAFASQYFRPVIFVELNFATGPVRIFSGIGTITWNGHDWSGLGQLTGISVIESGVDTANGISVSCSGIDSAMLTDALNEIQVGLPAYVYVGCFDGTGAVMPDPFAAWVGRVDQPSIDIGPDTSTISIDLESRIADFNNAANFRYTNDAQQIVAPGDRAFEFVNSLVSSSVNWGRTPQQSFAGR